MPIAEEASAVFMVITDFGSFRTKSATNLSDFLNSGRVFLICLNNFVGIRLEYLS